MEMLGQNPITPFGQRPLSLSTVSSTTNAAAFALLKILSRPASTVRPHARHQSSAWEEACAAMGDGQVSVGLAAILQRGAAIKSPGGYLRILACRAATGSSRSGRC
jgi:hypothetical protein